MTNAKEQMIYARGRWEIARTETNALTGKAQWIRRDYSFICSVGEEIAAQDMPAKPEGADAFADVLKILADNDGACLYWQMPNVERGKAAAAEGFVRWEGDLLVHPDAVEVEPEIAYAMPNKD